MTTLVLPALEGRKPLGFLAAVGLTRLLTVHGGARPKLSWRRDDVAAVLDGPWDSVGAVVDVLKGIVSSIPEDGVVPGAPAELPPPGEAPDKLRLPPGDLRQLAVALAATPDPEIEAWLASLVTDLSLDDKRRSDITLMAAPSGKQSMRTMLQKPLAQLRSHPDCLGEALTGWRRRPGVTGEYLDHQVLFDAGDSGFGESEERGVPGATWLALMAYPLMRTTAAGAEPITTGWYRKPRRPAIFVYPLWATPLDLHAMSALLDHPLWSGGLDGALPDGAAALGVFTMGRAQRRRIPGRTFAGVLGPLP